MGKILKYWPKDEIIRALKELPKDKPINKKSIIEYSNKKLICNSSLISKKFGTLKEACKQAHIRCDALYGKEKIEYMQKINTRWNKEKIDNILKDVFNNKKIKTISNYEKYAKGKKEIPSTDVICKYYKTMENALKENNIKYDSYYWPKERIIKQLKFLDRHYGPLARCEINHIYSKKGLICRIKCIRDVCGSLEKATELAGITFVEAQEKGYTNGKVGKKETTLLNDIENKKKIILMRQFKIKTKDNVYFIDGYDKEHNIAYEVDEKQHQYNEQQYLDNIRENEIKNILNCKFERIKTD